MKWTKYQKKACDGYTPWADKAFNDFMDLLPSLWQ